jgi:hypothetical protein
VLVGLGLVAGFVFALEAFAAELGLLVCTSKIVSAARFGQNIVLEFLSGLVFAAAVAEIGMPNILGSAPKAANTVLVAEVGSAVELPEVVVLSVAIILARRFEPVVAFVLAGLIAEFGAVIELREIVVSKAAIGYSI